MVKTSKDLSKAVAAAAEAEQAAARQRDSPEKKQVTSECIAVQLARQDGMQNVHNTKLFRGDNDDIMAQL